MFAYAITDPTTLNFDTLTSDLVRFSHKASMIVYRDKHTKKYDVNAEQFVFAAKNFDKVLLHGDYLLSKQCKADGVHLKSTQFEDISKAKEVGLFVIVSTHTIEEARKAELLGADMITFSPIFYTPNKGKAVGLNALKDVVLSVKIPVIALGGILTQSQIYACADAGAKGFASIRYFSRNILN
jgi:thiamine-phosphate pyrophosphorylase